VSSGGGAPAPPRRVCFFGTYARDYTVTALLMQACRAAGIAIVECHRPLWEETRHKEAAYFAPRSIVRLLRQYIAHAGALVRQRRAVGPVLAYVVGFNGQLDCLLLRAVLRRQPTPIVFAPLITLTETLVDDRAVFRPHSLWGVATRILDRLTLSAASHVLIDTAAHRQYLIDTFGVAPGRVSVWHLGADTRVFTARPPETHDGPLRVLFYGSFLPLHGVRTVIDAAALLQDDINVEFVLVGDGPDHAACVAAARAAGLTRLHFRPWVPYDDLGNEVARADICLGGFGAGVKTRIVIPNKVYQAAAVGRPVITADTPAMREIFTHGETVWLCASNDPTALATAIRTLGGDVELRARLGRQAATLLAERFSAATQGERLAAIFAEATRLR